MKFNIAIIGLSHKTSSIELRESLSFTLAQKQSFLRILKENFPEGEFIILSTCNRVELYIGGCLEGSQISRIISLLASFHNVSREEIYPFIYRYQDEQALKHLFEVSSSLDSLVIGESQILGQIKEAYKLSLELGMTAKNLNTFFQKSFAVSKRIRVQTNIGMGNVSISTIACQLVGEILGNLDKTKILIVGMGNIGKFTLKSLKDKGANSVLVSNRSNEKAKLFAEEFKGTAINFDQVEYYLGEVDVAITSTLSPNYLIDYKMMSRIMKRRENNQIFLIDLAVPRDIDPEISNIPAAHLYNVDSLKNIANKNRDKREQEILKCREIINNSIQHLFLENEENKFCKTF
ncbi:MAG: glutamyl-tRNA reductase [Candidatus Omnitrophota bacterium]